MKRRYLRKVTGLILAVGLFTGMSGVLAAPAFASATSKPIKFRTKVTYVAVYPLNQNGGYSVGLDGSSKGVATQFSVSGSATQGSATTTKIRQTFTDVMPGDSSGSVSSYHVGYTAPGSSASINGNVVAPTGYTVAAINVTLKCTGNWSDGQWKWVLTISGTASPA